MISALLRTARILGAAGINRCAAAIAVVFCGSFAGNAAGQTTPVTVEMQQFGLGGVARPGTMTPIRLNLTDSGSRPRRVQVQWTVEDSDGDQALYAREMTLNPGLPNETWLYIHLPFTADSGTTFDVTVIELDEQGREGANVAATRFRPPRVLDPVEGVIGVVGTSTANLNQYDQWPGLRGEASSGHEFLRALTGLRFRDLPDRWMGLDLLRTLVVMEGDPSVLSIDQGAAVREWVQRGGHLVIVLPQVGMPWSGTQLDAILPEVSVLKWPDVALDAPEAGGGVLSHLSSRPEQLSLLRETGSGELIPVRVTFNVFALPSEAAGVRWADLGLVPMMEVTVPASVAGSERRLPIVVQRQVGFGRVTLVGVPVNDPQLQRAGLRLPEAEVFWNRLLGLRQDTPDSAELQRLMAQPQQRGATDRVLNTMRKPSVLSLPIPAKLNLTWHAGSGLFLATLVFLTYWGLSGPAAFLLLKQRGLAQYSWLAFVALATIFTGISWVGASALRSDDIRPQHFTVLTHIAESPLQKATTYFTAALDGFNTARVRVGDPEDEDGGSGPPMHNAVYSFSAPRVVTQGFPDSRSYLVESADPEEIRAPARSTAKQMTARWVGPPQAGWGMPTYLNDADRPRVTVSTGEGAQQGREIRLSGRIAHTLPGPLRDVTVYHVTPVRYWTPRPPDNLSGKPWLRVHAWAFNQWDANSTLDLSSFSHDVDSIVWRENNHFARMETSVSRNSYFDRYGASFSGASRDERLAFELLTFYGMMTPPVWVSAQADSAPLFQRELGREWDLSEWMTRPCLIITGYVESSPIPTPIYLDGERLEQANAKSETYLRWVYPLPADSEPGAM